MVEHRYVIHDVDKELDDWFISTTAEKMAVIVTFIEHTEMYNLEVIAIGDDETFEKI